MCQSEFCKFRTLILIKRFIPIDFFLFMLPSYKYETIEIFF